MANEPVQPQVGRRPVYPVDTHEAPSEGRQAGVRPAERKPTLPAPGSKDDPASDENTESANHPNDE
ncbi:hypothetical protein J2X20_001994 [Pelomonas saccharophila]|jgi:hypothetical protein|uniref:Uncharacterized protein n=1 Tax=Roseateles saccharophilus TaxID=304 RepID=A0ABU1YKH3_ROSSA|nr:hypothetical protein [Roseateles saccharophilus]MDR7269365.1 hypothetical protein [Roseateles saccharophilus]